MNTNDKREGIWIPMSLIRNEELDWVNKVLMAEIESLSKLKSGCIASNAYFGRLVGLSPGSVSKRITRLTQLRYIKTRNEYENHSCMGRIIIPLNRVWEPSHTVKEDQVPVVPEQTGYTSQSTNEDIPERPGGTSWTTMGDIPQRPGGTSQENTIITHISTDIKTESSSDIQEHKLGPNTGENHIQLIPGTSLNIEDYPKWYLQSGLKIILKNYPKWQIDVEELGLEMFVDEAKKFCRITPECIEYIKAYQYYLSYPVSEDQNDPAVEGGGPN